MKRGASAVVNGFLAALIGATILLLALGLVARVLLAI
jgi:hypothetical protein